MKQLLFRAFFALLVTGSLFSCNDDDDVTVTPPVGGDLVKTDAEAYALANAVYGPLQTLSSSYSFLLESSSESTISFEGVETAQGPVVSRFEVVPTNGYVVKIFNALYKSIGAANETISQLNQSSPNGKLTAEVIKLAIARVKFVRALDYHYLVQLFGEVPLVLTNATPVTTVRSSIDDVYTQIVKDLTEAEADLPAFDGNKFNPTKGSANAILARVYLAWGEKPLSFDQVAAIASGKTDPTPQGVDNAKLQKAVDYADKVIGGGNYALLADFEKIFGKKNQNNAEIIFSIHHEGDGIDAQGNHQTHCPFTFPFELYKDNHIGPADVTLIDRFADEDTRKHYSYVTKLTNPTDKLEYEYTFPVTSSRYGKFIHRSADGSDTPTAAQINDIDRIEIRLAEVYLIKAEALFFLNKAGEALDLVNALRQRAFGSHYDHVGKLTSLDKDKLFKEWELELTFEQKRWTNLTRWSNLISTVKTVDQFEYYKEDYKTADDILSKFGAKDAKGRDTNAAFFAKVYLHLHAKYNNVSGKHYRFPIPPGSAGEDLGIAQNPGY